MIILKKDSKIVFIGGDKRQKIIYENIKKDYENTSLLAFGANKYNSEEVKNSDIIVFPTVLTKDGVLVLTPEYNGNLKIDDVLKDIVNSKIVIGGVIPVTIKEKLINYNIKFVEYTEIQPFKILNAIPTVEGAISIAIQNSSNTLWKCNCLIIGNGCIGKRLCKTLKDMGAFVTVSARNEVDFSILESENINFTHTSFIEDKLKEFDIIFNTVPKKIISNSALKMLDESTIIIDLSSYPYGFDYTLIDTVKCKIIPAQSLPGKYSPVTAANIAAKTVKNIIDEV